MNYEEILKNWDNLSDAERAEVRAAATKAQSEDIAQMDLPEYAWETAKNVPSSTAQLGKDLIAAVLSPIDTAETLWDLAKGTAQNLTGMGSDEEAQRLAMNVAKFYSERYGDLKSAKVALAQDPAGVLSDLSAVLGIGATALPARMGGKVLGATAAAIEPLQVAGELARRGLGKLEGAPSAVMGGLTGTGAEPIRESFEAGAEGGQRLDRFTSALRGDVDPRALLGDMNSALERMRLERQQAYKAGMGQVAQSTAPLTFDGIDAALDAAKERVTYGDKIVSERGYAVYENLKEIVDEWRAGDPAVYHTAIGMDKLKQRIGDAANGLPFEQENARGLVKDVYDAVKRDIEAQAPEYAKTMKDYTEASELLREIRQTLSFKPNATVDTQLRKLTAIMRNNVNTAYGYRGELVGELEQAGGVPLKPTLAGMAADTWTPRGIQGATTGLAEIGMLYSGGLDPTNVARTAAVAAATSPRLVAETARATGISLRKAKEIFERYPNLAFIKDPMTRVMLYQTEEAKRQGAEQ